MKPMKTDALDLAGQRPAAALAAAATGDDRRLYRVMGRSGAHGRGRWRPRRFGDAQRTVTFSEYG